MFIFVVLCPYANYERLWPIWLLLMHYFLLYFYPRTKYELDWMNSFRDMVIQNYTRRLTAAILDLVQLEIAPFDPPTSKTLP